MKILITGGSGFLGRNLIERLKSEGHDISCLDRYLAPFLEEYGVRTIQGDIYEQVAVDEAVRGMDVVVHMACTTLPKTSNDDPYFDVLTNVGGSIRLLDSAVKNNIKKFVFISSGGTVYGTPTEVPIKEITHKCKFLFDNREVFATVYGFEGTSDMHFATGQSLWEVSEI